MDTNYELKYHRIEKEHFWFAGVRALILKLLKNTPQNAAILDVGCSGGQILQSLNAQGYHNTTGIDKSERAIEVCHKKGLKNVSVMDASELDFPDETFHIVIASCIIEHIDDDQATLREWYRVLKKGGKLIVMTSAFEALWSDHDVVNHHYRRYTRQDFLEKIKSAGFEINHWTYWNFFLFLPVLIIRLFQNLIKKKDAQPQSDFDTPPSWINAILTQVLNFETFLSVKARLPVGVNILAVAKKG